MGRYGASITALLVMACIVAIPRTAGAVKIYDDTSTRTYENVFGPAPMLDDVTFALPAGTPPVTVNAITFGARNIDVATTVDALVTFFNTANVNATGSTTVESGNLGTVRIAGLAVPAATGSGSGIATYTRTLPTPVTITDGDAAVRITFVLPSTNTISDNVDALLTADLPTVGSTADKYWSDQGSFNQTFTGSEAVGPDLAATPPVHANFYLALDTSPVPEPTSLLLLAPAGLLMLGRRRRR